MLGGLNGITFANALFCGLSKEKVISIYNKVNLEVNKRQVECILAEKEMLRRKLNEFELEPASSMQALRLRTSKGEERERLLEELKTKRNSELTVRDVEFKNKLAKEILITLLKNKDLLDSYDLTRQVGEISDLAVFGVKYNEIEKGKITIDIPTLYSKMFRGMNQNKNDLASYLKKNLKEFDLYNGTKDKSELKLVSFEYMRRYYDEPDMDNARFKEYMYEAMDELKGLGVHGWNFLSEEMRDKVCSNLLTIGLEEDAINIDEGVKFIMKDLMTSFYESTQGIGEDICLD